MKHILYIDDDQQAGILAMIYLERAGFKVHVCSNTQKARNILQQKKIDMIITDVGLPGENGLDFYKWLKSSSPYVDIPVLIVSAHAVGFNGELILSPDDFLAKPIFFPELIERIKNRFDNEPDE